MAEPQEHTAMFKIFHYYIDTQIPALYAYENQATKLGMPVFEQAGGEKEYLAEKVYVRKTVNQLIELHAKGCPIIFNKPDDTLKIYGWLKEALETLHQRYSSTLHTNKIPIESITKMDEFARSLHMVARKHQDVDITKSHLSQSIEKMMQQRGLSRRSRIKPVGNRNIKPKPPEHESFIPKISQTAFDRKLKFEGED